MRISLDWIADHVDLSGLAPGQIAESLTASTALIEEVIDQKAALAGVVVARVLEQARHPGADRLSLCRVDHGTGEPASVVCGAPNVAAGQTVLYAPVGTRLPDGRKLKAAKIRGEASEGMICAEDELGLGPEHDGILVLSGDLSPGQPAAEVCGLAQVLLDIDNKSVTHRPDLWGHYGFAREIAAIFGRTLQPLPVDLGLRAEAAGASFALEAGSACPVYAGLSLTAAPGRSPDWLRFRLIACGLRPRNLPVDLSNYVMLELGQPTHPFDRDTLVEDRIVVRRARADEELVTLDGVTRRLTGGDLLIADGARAVALAGIMGAAASEVSETTRRILLESASFDPIVVRRTSARLGLRSEALARFEKGLDPALVEQALRRYAHLLAPLDPQARVEPGFRVAGAAAAPATVLDCDPARLRRRLGMAVSTAEIRTKLASLGFGVRAAGTGEASVDPAAVDDAPFEVEVPSWRATRDVTRREDLEEEVARLAGYDRLPVAPVRGPLRAGRRDPVLAVEDRLRDALAGSLRFTETLSYSMIPDSLAARLGARAGQLPRLRNALQQDAAQLRPGLAPGLLSRLETWLRHEPAPRVFEIGRGYATGADGLVAERREAAALLAWRAPGPDARDVVRELRGVAQGCLDALGLPEARLEVVTDSGLLQTWWHPRRTARLVSPSDGRCLGELGAVAPDWPSDPGVEAQAGLLVLDLAALAALPGAPARFRTLSRFPPARIDLAFVLPYDLPVAAVVEELRKAGPATLASVEAFDVYRGPPLGPDERSVAFHLVFQSAQRTLRDEEVETAQRRMVAAITALGGRLR